MLVAPAVTRSHSGVRMHRGIPRTGLIPHGVTPCCPDCPAMDRRTQSSRQLQMEGWQEASPAPQRPTPARQGCTTGKTHPLAGGQTEAISLTSLSACSPPLRLAVVSVHYAGRTALLVIPLTTGKTHGAAVISRAEPHTHRPAGRTSPGARGNLMEKHPGEPTPEGSRRGFLRGGSRAKSLLSRPHSELLLLEWDMCFLRGRSS